MKLRFRLTIIIGILTTATIAIIAVILLRQARMLQTQVAYENIKNLCQAEATQMAQEFEVFMNTIDTISKIYSSFRQVDMPLRRNYFDNMLQSAVQSNPEFVGIYSVWKLGVIDNGNPIYSTLYTREHGTRERDVITRYDFSQWNVPEYTRCQESIAANEAWQWMLPFPIPFVNRGRDVFVVFMTAPIIDNQTKELYGFVGVGVDISPMQEHVNSLKPYKTGSAQLISTNGTIASHPEPDFIGKNFHEMAWDRFGEETVRDLEDTLQSGQYHQVTHDGNIMVTFPIHVGTTKTYWSIAMEVEEKTVLAEVFQMRTFTIFFSLAMVFIVTAIVFVVILYTTRPISRVALALKDVSEGEGDLTKRIPEKGNDEIADMSHYFNLTMEKISSMVGTIKNEASSLLEIGNNLASQQSESASAVNEINANILNTKTMVTDQSASVAQTGKTMEKITAIIKKLNEYIEQESSSVSQSSSAIEEMLANIQSVTTTLGKNLENVENLVEASDVGHTGLQTVSQDIQEIARESEGLLEINSVMKNIASQTNLLSMNAAIEAAHAGEAGKGFAVVADEIRKLAENSGNQSKTISTVLKKIKTSIDKISVSTDNVLKKFEAIETSVKTVTEQEENVRNAMEEQSVGSKQILESIGRLNEITNLLKQGSTEMLEGSQQVIKESGQLEMITRQINGGMNDMATGMDEINTATNNINDISMKNKQSIDILVNQVSRFKVD